MDYTILLGLVAGSLTTAAFIPQLHRAWKTKSLEDVSLLTYIAFTIGVFLWAIYGFVISSLPVILTNSVTFVLASSILILKIQHKKQS
ncbi:MAG: SemiSWEET transporter [Actinomycetia bacterium]|nr:SemiSWEET transporter [Actinomycetes bacterium]